MRPEVSKSQSRKSQGKASSHIELNNIGESHYRTLIEILPQLVWMADADGNTTYCNQHWYTYSGLTPEETGKNGWVAVIHPDDRESASRLWRKAIASSETCTIECRFRRAVDGRYRWHLVKSSRLQDGHGAMVKWIGLALDIHDHKMKDAELARKDEQLRIALDVGRLGTWDCDLLSGELLCSERYRTIFGLEPGARFSMRKFFALTHPEDRSHLEELFNRANMGEGPEEFETEYRIIRKDGQLRWINARGKCRFADLAVKRQLAGFAGTVQDVTEPRLATDALRASEARLRTILDAEPECVKLLSRDFVLREMNPAGLEIIEADSLDQVLHQSLIRLVNEPYRKPFEEMTQQVFEGRQCKLKFEITTLKGSHRWLEIYAAPLQDKDGRVDALLGISRDITEQKMIEAALRASEAKFRALIENSNDAIALLTADWKFAYASAATERILGYRSNELLNTGSLALVHPDDVPVVQLRLDECLANPGKPIGSVGRVRHKDGSWRVLEGVLTNLLLDPDVGAVVCNFRDITEKVHAERQLQIAQKMETIGELAGGVAHDFNNLLMIMGSRAEMILDAAGQPGQVAKQARQIIQATRRAAILTRELLAFSRDQVLQPCVLNLNLLVEELGNMMPRLIGEHIETRIIAAPGSTQVKVDRGQFEQVIMNLAINARDAMPHGGTLRIETRRISIDHSDNSQPGLAPGAYVLLMVTDSGIGMTPEVQARIFEPFFTTKERGRGTGLGLAMVYGIVQQSGGHICVESAQGKGTTFKIYIPEVAQPAATEKQQIALAFSRGTETILFVEDEDLLRDVGCEILRAKGYKVLAAANGEEALAIIQNAPNSIDLLITDVIMPRLGGIELAKQVLKFCPQLRIIYVSGYSGQPLNSGSMVEGAQFLQKPFSITLLTTYVRTALDSQV
ncbi:MAG TPA: PAS domain S-box protein [Candidatus Angelobacter sp.]|jgi:PAS domain S-box-containing protein